ncbi:MAG: hypothetical protein ACXIUM_05015 [Wenzhouxiangella sp.]
MSRYNGSRRFREQIVGRTISGVIARPGRDGEPPVVLMLRFEDGGVVEFVSPRSELLIKEALLFERQGAKRADELGEQLPLAGLFGAASPESAGLALGAGSA